MLLYEHVVGLLTARLDTDTLPMFDPGPPTPEQMKSTPNRLVFVSVGSGAGLNYEGGYDRVLVAIRSAGNQNDFADAERQALAIDAVFCSIGSPVIVAGTRWLYATRAGGRPALLGMDSADRYHLTCSYVVNAATG